MRLALGKDKARHPIPVKESDTMQRLPALLFAATLVIALLGLGLDACLRRLQRLLDPTMRS